MVASSVVAPPAPPVIRLPTATLTVADAAVDRRTQFAVLFEIELGRMHHRLLRRDGGFGDALGLGALVVSLLGDGLVAEELLAALQVGVGEGEIGARLRQIGLHLLEHDLERPAVDGEQQIALLHHLAVDEMDFREIAGQPRADLDQFHRGEATDIFVLVDHGALHRIGHSHGRRRGSVLFLLRLTAAGQHGRDAQSGETDRQAIGHEFVPWAASGHHMPPPLSTAGARPSLTLARLPYIGATGAAAGSQPMLG